MDDNIFLIYELKTNGEMRDLSFEPLDRIKTAGLSVKRDNYIHMYTGTLEPGMTLEGIYQRFNIDRPEDFTGHSLSVSDIVVLRSEEKWAAHYVDSFGFSEVPEFLYWPHKYYSTQRPVDIGTFPKTESGPVQIVNFDKREWMENATFKAWGYLVYNAPLTQTQIDDYELRAASDNPDHTRPSPYQVAAQTQIVGKWEQSKRTPEIKRLTWWYGDFGVFAKKDFVTTEQIAERFGQITESKTRAAEKRAASKIPDVKRSTEEKVQIVGIWEDENKVPENERFTWMKPSIHAFALREPVVAPGKLERRYNRAIRDLTRADEERATGKSIADQLAEGAEQAARDNAARPAPAQDKDKGDRT